MKSLSKYFLFGHMFWLTQSILVAQNPVDCSSAIVVCDNQQLNYNSNGPGADDFGPGPNDNSNGCLSGGEHQSAWFLIFISSSSPPNATLAFTITPTAGMGEDYDFAIWGPGVECNLLGDPIRCSWAAGFCGFCPETGLGMGTTDFSEGADGDGFVAEIVTQPGESYILLVDNYNASNQGFFLDWTGTAILSCSCTTIPVIAGELEICDGETTVLTVTGNDLNEYLWAASGGGIISGPSNQTSITATAPGTYTVTVSDINGCTGTAAAVVTEAAGPEISFTVQPEICGESNGSINLSISGGIGPYNYIWSNGATTEDLTGLPGGSYSVTVTGSTGCTSMMVIEVPQQDLVIQISANVANNTSCLQGNGSITVTVTPSGSYMYAWSNGETGSTIFNLSSGTYILTVTSTGNCTQTASFTIMDEPNVPYINSSVVPSVCDLANGEINLTVTGGVMPYTYLWSTGETSEDLDGLAAGLYSITVTGDNGCPISLDIVVTNNNPPLNISSVINHNTSCTTSNGSISTTINPPVSPTGDVYIYTWSNGSSSSSINDLAPGTYHLTVEGGGSCTQTVSFTILDQPLQPQINATIIAAHCGQDNGAIQINAGGGVPPFTYQWNDGSTGSELSNLLAGTYSVTVTGGNGCSATANLIVQDMPIVFTVNPSLVPNTVCAGEGNGSILITVVPGGAYTFLWSNGETGASMTNLVAGNYSVTVSAGGNCNQELTFVLPDEPALPEFNTEITSSVCDVADGGATILPTGGEGPFTFIWSNGESTQSIQNVMAGTYSVTVTGANECSTTAIVAIPNEQIVIQITGVITQNTSCLSANGAIDLSISPSAGITFLWSNGETSEDITELSAGTYTVTVSAGNTCSATATFTIDDMASGPELTAVVTAALCGEDNGEINLSVSGGMAPYIYEWSSGEQAEDITNLFAGNYTVTVTDINNCFSVLMVNVPDMSSDFTISGNVTSVTSCEQGNGSVNLTIDPPGMYEYLWSNGEFTEDIINLAPGFYSVTVTQSGSCSGSAGFMVNDETESPTYDVSITHDQCQLEVGSIELTNLTGKSPFVILWSNGENSSKIEALGPGNYGVTVTDNNGCITVSSHEIISENASISITGLTFPNTLCVNPNGKIDITVIPSGSYSFLWSNGTTTEDLSDLSSGNYSVTVSLGSCTTTATFFVGSDASAMGLNSTVADVSCHGGNDGFIDLEITAGIPPFTFSWTPALPGSPEDLTDIPAGGYSVTVTDQAGCTITASFVILQPDAIVLSCGQISSVSAPGASDGEGAVNISGGTPPYAVSWTPGNSESGLPSGTFNISSLSEGDFDIEVIDANGCIATCHFTITAEACITASGSMATQPQSVCGAGCVSGGYDTTGQVLPPGDIVQFILHQGPGTQIQNEIARAVQPLFCFDPGVMQYDVQYYISAVAGPDDGTGNVLLLSPCTRTTSGTPVIFYDIPQASIDDPGQIDCDHPEIELTGHSTLTNATFAWSTRTGNILTDPFAAVVRVNKGGHYMLIVTSHICSDTSEVNVEQSVDYPSLIPLTDGDLSCKDSLVTLSGYTTHPDADLFWAIIISGDTTIIGNGGSLEVYMPGIYYLLGIADNGCSNALSFTVDAFMNTPSVEAGEDIFLSCDLPSLNVSAIASGGVSYFWIPPVGVQLPVFDSSSIIIDQPGSYMILVTDTTSHCTAIDTILVQSSQDAPVSTVVANQVSCFGENDGSLFILPQHGQEPFTYLINGNNYGSTNFFSSLRPGIYHIEVLDAGGCRWSSETEIMEPDPLLVSLGADIAAHPGEMITLEVVTNVPTDQMESVVWKPGQSGNCLNEPCTQIEFSFLMSTTVSVTVMDTNGCFSSDTLSVLIMDDRNVFVPNTFSPNGDGHNDIFTLFAASGVRNIDQLSIYSRWGELIFNRDNIAPNDLTAGWDGTFRGQQMGPGVYVWKAKIEFNNGEKKMLFGDITLLR